MTEAMQDRREPEAALLSDCRAAELDVERGTIHCGLTPDAQSYKIAGKPLCPDHLRDYIKESMS